MVMLLPKRWGSLLVALTIVILAGAVVLGFGRITGPGTPTTSQGGGSHVLIKLSQTPRLLGPGIIMNYTLTLVPGLGALGKATLSSISPLGLTVSFNPSSVTLTGSEVAVDVTVGASKSITAGDYDVGFRVIWPSGSTNLTFRFTVVPHVILILGGGTPGPGPFYPSVLQVHPGETVTWISLDAGSDEYAGLRAVRIVELNVTSPTLMLYSVWSHAFAQPGEYHILDPINGGYVPEGTIVVG